MAWAVPKLYPRASEARGQRADLDLCCLPSSCGVHDLTLREELSRGAEAGEAQEGEGACRLVGAGDGRSSGP